jgi:hypothetical protein
MTTKPKTCKAPATVTGISPKMREMAAKIDKLCGSTTTFSCDDPIFPAIDEHKALTRESTELERSYRDAVDKAEKKYGDRIEHHRGNRSAPWPGSATTDPFYDRWNSAGRAARKAAMRMARTTPESSAGAAAMITHARREICRDHESAEDWVTIALKTVAAALTVPA